MVYQKLCHLYHEHCQKIKNLFQKYTDVIAESFDDVRPSNAELRHEFELMSNQRIFQKAMLFVLMNSGATFQRMMDSILANVHNIKFYVDDVVIHSATKEKHIIHLETIIKLLKKHGPRMRLHATESRNNRPLCRQGRCVH